MAQFVSDCLRTMRLTLARRNETDPDSTDPVMKQYIDDFVNLSMSDDLRVFEQYGTLRFTIDQTNPTGVYTFNDVGADAQFVSISQEAFISLTTPPEGSISWNRLAIWQDPGMFFDMWGVNNADVLIPGYPTDLLFYGNEFTFRTIPNTSYDVFIYGYKVVPAFSDVGDPKLPFDYWMRYIAYGAALNYARDYRYDGETRQQIQADFSHERKYLLSRMHSYIKGSRSFPRY